MDTTCHIEGGVSLVSYTNIKSWLARIEKFPDYIAMDKSPIVS